MKFKILSLLVFVLSILFSCKSTKNQAVKKMVNAEKKVGIEEIDLNPPIPQPIYNHNINYRGTKKIVNDLIHTELHVSFDWEKQQLIGKAFLDLKAHFYETSKLELDAKGFDIQSVKLINGDTEKTLKYEYTGMKILIELDKNYAKDEKYRIQINYIAKPNELSISGGRAIRKNQGLYFINPLNTDAGKPRQIWTQGEPESSSCWFPTIDSPNQKSSEEIFITTEKEYVTLSNGVLYNSLLNEDGTRTDHWKQDKPHSPYLFMLAVGDFAVVEDHWRNMKVNYYVEPEYEQDAKAIFGKTPRMIDFFSKILGVDYPWDKYSQIIVRDYVSGAMENTGAVVFGEFVQMTKRELIDKNYESIVAHELSHHWFGDLVVCESWANLPLNESFATYAQYLWDEHEYGRFEADYNLRHELNGYFSEARHSPKNLIRFYYDKPDDMFDAHSYNKGGRVLHMLRKYVGDDAFFAALKLYLTENQYGSAEIHNLRMAFEKITGEDLNWFFNQWFLAKGNPVLEINYRFDAKNEMLFVNVRQKQDKEFPTYRLPVKIDIYLKDSVLHEEILMLSRQAEFNFPLKEQPVFVNFDAEKMLLCQKEETKTNNEFIAQYWRAPLFLDKIEALEKLTTDTRNEKVKAIFDDALRHKFWYIRLYALENYRFGDWKTNDTLIEKLKKIALNDPKSQLRRAALRKLEESNSKDLLSLYKKIMERDSSVLVMRTVLNQVSRTDAKTSIELADKLINDKYLSSSILSIYKTHGTADKADLFKKIYANAEESDKWSIIQSYGKFICRFDTKTSEEGLKFLKKVSETETAWWLQGAGMQAIYDVRKHYKKQVILLSEEPKSAENEKLIADYKAKMKSIKDYLNQYIAKQKNKRLKSWFNSIQNDL